MTDAEILAIADATMFTKPDTVWQDDALKFARAILAATPDRSVGACSRCKGSSYVITGLGESAGAEECPACVGGHADRSVGEVPSVPENVMHAIGNLGTKAKNFGVAMQAKPGFSKDEQAAFLGAHEALVFAVKQALAADRSARGGEAINMLAEARRIMPGLNRFPDAQLIAERDDLIERIDAALAASPAAGQEGK